MSLHQITCLDPSLTCLCGWAAPVPYDDQERITLWKAHNEAATEELLDRLADKIAALLQTGTKADLAANVTAAIRDAVARGRLPKNVLTAL